MACQARDETATGAPVFGAVGIASLTIRETLSRKVRCPMPHTEHKIMPPEMPEPVPGFPNFGYLALHGVDNARDLGGMPAADGKRIRKRRLLRSGALGEATAADIKQLVRMHEMEYVVDLRAPLEVERTPDPLPLLSGVEYVSLPPLPDGAIITVGRMSVAKDKKLMQEFTGHPFETIKDLYPKAILGELGIEAYGRFLHDLLEAEEGATLWHCTQGKDRTGIAAILVEHALGVPHEVIVADYLATNLFISGWMARMERLLRATHLAKGLDADIEAYAYAHTVYFEAAMDAMRGVFGSVDAYLERELDFGEAEKRQLRMMYLE